jgi:hypothetical protein
MTDRDRVTRATEEAPVDDHRRGLLGRASRAALALALVLSASLLHSQEQGRETDPELGQGKLPPGIEIEAQDQVRVTPDGFEFTGPVTIRWRDSLIARERLSFLGGLRGEDRTRNGPCEEGDGHHLHTADSVLGVSG